MGFWLEDFAAFVAVLRRLLLLLPAELEAVYMGTHVILALLTAFTCAIPADRVRRESGCQAQCPATTAKTEPCVYKKMQKLLPCTHYEVNLNGDRHHA